MGCTQEVYPHSLNPLFCESERIHTAGKLLLIQHFKSSFKTEKSPKYSNRFYVFFMNVINNLGLFFSRSLCLNNILNSAKPMWTIFPSTLVTPSNYAHLTKPPFKMQGIKSKKAKTSKYSPFMFILHSSYVTSVSQQRWTLGSISQSKTKGRLTATPSTCWTRTTALGYSQISFYDLKMLMMELKKKSCLPVFLPSVYFFRAVSA